MAFSSRRSCRADRQTIIFFAGHNGIAGEAGTAARLRQSSSQRKACFRRAVPSVSNHLPVGEDHAFGRQAIIVSTAAFRSALWPGEGQPHVARHLAVGRGDATQSQQPALQQRRRLVQLEVLDEVGQHQRARGAMEEDHLGHEAAGHGQVSMALVPADSRAAAVEAFVSEAEPPAACCSVRGAR